MSKVVRPEDWSEEVVADRFREMLGSDEDTSREARRRRTILLAGYQLFLQHGYKKTTIDDVARKARVAKGTVYLYFENKAQLLIHCIAHEKLIVKAEASKIFAPETPDKERLRQWLWVSLFSIRDMPLSTRLMTGDMEMLDALDTAGAGSGKIEAMREEGLAVCAHLMELAAPGAFDEAERKKRARVLFSISFASAQFLDERMRQGESLNTFLETLIEVLLHGVVPPPANLP